MYSHVSASWLGLGSGLGLGLGLGLALTLTLTLTLVSPDPNPNPNPDPNPNPNPNLHGAALGGVEDEHAREQVKARLGGAREDLAPRPAVAGVGEI